MRLNSLKPTAGAKKPGKRVGRGIGSGKGKTCGRGHKGQKSRAGYNAKKGFEGGQMPLHRRIPKLGFRSRVGMTTEELRLSELAKMDVALVDLPALKKANLINANTKRVKVIATGKIEKALTLKGIKVTAGARKLIEQAGGKIE